MATGTPRKATDAIDEGNLKQVGGINFKDDNHDSETYQTHQQQQQQQQNSYSSSPMTSRSCSSGDGVTYSSSSNSSDIDSRQANKANEGNDAAAFDCDKENHGNELNSSVTNSPNGVKSCKSSRSTTVARCFESASYMTPRHQQDQTINVTPSDNSRIVAGAANGSVQSGIAGSQHLLSHSSGVGGVLENLWPECLPSTGLTSSAALTYVGGIGFNPYNIWSSACISPLANSALLVNSLAAANVGAATADTLFDLRSRLLPGTAVMPTNSAIKRLMMIYHCKFGEFGVGEGQFTEPSGVAVNTQSYIIVADTNNHRIQIFDKGGHFKFQFGECGKRDSQLLYPNRVAVSRLTGDIIITERSPTHQVQIFNQYGQFVRKFGANILQHPRGLTVDHQGRIIVVECKVMRIIIFDPNGNVLNKFGCNKHLRFPNGVVVNDKEEIFISDNRAHCVKVFNYEGRYLRQIGGEGLTNYPIGVCLTARGEVLIADNHNNFNLTVFTQDGQLVSAHESRVKHAQCLDVALMDNGSVVLASKDYRVYLYRYAQTLPLGL